MSTEVPKTCATCAHRNGSLAVGYGVCMLSGVYISTERKYPSVCGRDFNGWVPRQGLWPRIRQWWLGPAQGEPHA